MAYLEGLGWQVEPQPIETLDLQLPEKLEGEWSAYAKLQAGQNLPFADFGGQAVKRYPYTVTNYPAVSYTPLDPQRRAVPVPAAA